jgi:hypothetical protein
LTQFCDKRIKIKIINDLFGNVEYIQISVVLRKGFYGVYNKNQNAFDNSWSCHGCPV